MLAQHVIHQLSGHSTARPARPCLGAGTRKPGWITQHIQSGDRSTASYKVPKEEDKEHDGVQRRALAGSGAGAAAGCCCLQMPDRGWTRALPRRPAARRPSTRAGQRTRRRLLLPIACVRAAGRRPGAARSTASRRRRRRRLGSRERRLRRGDRLPHAALQALARVRRHVLPLRRALRPRTARTSSCGTTPHIRRRIRDRSTGSHPRRHAAGAGPAGAAAVGTLDAAGAPRRRGRGRPRHHLPRRRRRRRRAALARSRSPRRNRYDTALPRQPLRPTPAAVHGIAARAGRAARPSPASGLGPRPKRRHLVAAAEAAPAPEPAAPAEEPSPKRQKTTSTQRKRKRKRRKKAAAAAAEDAEAGADFSVKLGMKKPAADPAPPPPAEDDYFDELYSEVAAPAGTGRGRGGRFHRQARHEDRSGRC